MSVHPQRIANLTGSRRRTHDTARTRIATPRGTAIEATGRSRLQVRPSMVLAARGCYAAVFSEEAHEPGIQAHALDRVHRLGALPGTSGTPVAVPFLVLAEARVHATVLVDRRGGGRACRSTRPRRRGSRRCTRTCPHSVCPPDTGGHHRKDRMDQRGFGRHRRADGIPTDWSRLARSSSSTARFHLLARRRPPRGRSGSGS
jgi:hypothetical protein